MGFSYHKGNFMFYKHPKVKTVIIGMEMSHDVYLFSFLCQEEELAAWSVLSRPPDPAGRALQQNILE